MATHTFDPTHGKSLGEHAAGQPLAGEMRELDMAPGQEVDLEDATDNDGQTVFVAWYDNNRPDTPRRTSLDKDYFDEHFKAVSQ